MLEVFYFDKGLKKGDIFKAGRYKKPLWVDATGITKEEVERLGKQFGLHPVTEEDIHKSRVRIKVEEFQSYIFCVFYGIDPESTSLAELDFVLGRDFVITNHRKMLTSFEELKKDPDRLELLLRKGPDFVFHRLLELELENYLPVLEHIDDQVESIENQVAKKPTQKLVSQILALKRTITLIRKAALPQREKLSFLAKNEYSFVTKKAVPYFRDLYDHSINISDSIDNSRDYVGNAFEVYMSAVSNNMSSVMKFFSMIATIALPLTVISSIYGTNFRNLPGAEYVYGFWLMIAAMLFLSMIMLISFKWRDWS